MFGELTVLCTLSGARTYNGVLSVGDFNFSNIRGRYERVKYLTDRSQAPDIDWVNVQSGTSTCSIFRNRTFGAS